MDAFYTSSKVSRQLLSSLPRGFKPKKIADFSAGDGDLLIAARKKFPASEIHYNDTDWQAAHKVKRREIDWKVSLSDFLADRSVASSSYFRKKFDLILLNPPFSQRGISPIVSCIGGDKFKCSIALAFVCRALAFLSDAGYMLAILPAGCFVRQLDKEAWFSINKHFEIHHVRDLDCFAFNNVRASTRVVRFVRRAVVAKSQEQKKTQLPSSQDLVRGTFQMHFADDKGVGNLFELIHTTHLRNGVVGPSGRRVSWKSIVSGPALLLPRVGRVDKGKICVLAEGRRVVLSDCVFAVCVDSVLQAEVIRAKLLREWGTFAFQYAGTGAPYITSDKLYGFLSRYGCLREQVVSEGGELVEGFCNFQSSTPKEFAAGRMKAPEDICV